MLDYLAHMLEQARAGEPRGVLFFVWLYISLTCGGSAVHLLLLRRWPQVPARLRGLEQAPVGLEPVSAQRHYRLRVEYEYQVGGQTYLGTRLSPWKMTASGVARLLLALQARQLHAGEPLRAIHHPRRPHRSYLRRPGWGGIGFLLLLAAAGPLAWCWRYAAG